jgi:hypothetical protein
MKEHLVASSAIENIKIEKPNHKLKKALSLVALSLSSVLIKPEISNSSEIQVSQQELTQNTLPQGEVGFIRTPSHVGSLIRLKSEAACYLSNYHVFTDKIKEFQLYLESQKYQKDSSLRSPAHLVLDTNLNKVNTFHSKYYDIAAIETKANSCNRKNIEKTFGKVPTLQQFTDRTNDQTYKGKIMTHRSKRNPGQYEQERKEFEIETTGVTVMVSSVVQPIKLSHIYLIPKNTESDNSVTYGASGSPVTIETKDGPLYGFYDSKFEKKDELTLYHKMDGVYYTVVEYNQTSDKYIVANGALFRAERFDPKTIKDSEVLIIPKSQIANLKDILTSKGLDIRGKNIEGFAPLVDEVVEELDQQSKLNKNLKN